MTKNNLKKTFIPLITGILILGFIGYSPEAEATVSYNSADRSVAVATAANTATDSDSKTSTNFLPFLENVQASSINDEDSAAANSAQNSRLDPEQIQGVLSSSVQASAIDVGATATASDSRIEVEFDLLVITNFVLDGSQTDASGATLAGGTADSAAAVLISLFDVTRNQQVFVFSNTGDLSSSGSLAPGTYRLLVDAASAAATSGQDVGDGPVATASASIDFTLSLVDDAPPNTQITKAVDGKNVPPKKGKTSNNSMQFTFTGTDDVSVVGFQCSLDGAAFKPCTSPYSYTLLPQGAHNFQVRAVDNLGKVDPTPAQFNWFITSKTK